jgi:single-strand DNA-binding protein
MARSLNKVILIGNLTRDPELRYTPQGTAVATFGVATNRQWATDSGEKKEDVEFHRIVAWNKLAEICSQLLAKGRKVYIEGRLQTREWSGEDGAKRNVTEIVASEMILLDSKGAGGAASEEFDVPEADVPAPEGEKPAKKAEVKEKPAKKAVKAKDEDEEEIPF